jgi:hypothetical protein
MILVHPTNFESLSIDSVHILDGITIGYGMVVGKLTEDFVVNEHECILVDGKSSPTWFNW